MSFIKRALGTPQTPKKPTAAEFQKWLFLELKQNRSAEAKDTI
jgi:hypothetical protein